MIIALYVIRICHKRCLSFSRKVNEERLVERIFDKTNDHRNYIRLEHLGAGLLADMVDEQFYS